MSGGSSKDPPLMLRVGSAPSDVVRQQKTQLATTARKLTCAYLDNNDAYGFFEALGDPVISGPPQTNVNGFRAVLVME